MNVRAWIIPWYRKQDWADWCSLCKFQGSFEDWLARAEAGAKQQESLGHNVAKVVIQPGEFSEWSRVTGSKIDHDARMAYAISVFDSRDGTGH